MPWKASGDTPVNGVASKFDDVRQSLSKEAEHLAEMAAQYTRDAGAHAADIADDASRQATKLGSKATESAQSIARDPKGSAGGWWASLLKGLAGLGTAFALAGRDASDELDSGKKSVQNAAKGAAKDLRSLRLTTEPVQTKPDFMPGITLLAGFGAGIALMYFLDPERGRARRTMLRDKLTSFGRQASQTASGTATHLSNRAQGAMYETRKQFAGTGSTDVENDILDDGSATGFGTAENLAATDAAAADSWSTETTATTPYSIG